MRQLRRGGTKDKKGELNQMDFLIKIHLSGFNYKT
jgi:hypothetical protein